MLKMPQLPPLQTSRGTSGFFSQESNPLQMDTFFEAAGIAPSLGGTIPSVALQNLGQPNQEDFLGLSINQWLVVGGAVLLTAIFVSGGRR